MSFTQKREGFTLVELIVVITILAILGTIAFISFQGFSRSARDSARISDLNTITRALDYFKLEEGYYPDPTDFYEVSYSGSLAWKQGIFGEATRVITQKISSVPTDPLTGNQYTYSTINTRQEYELGAVTEAVIAGNINTKNLTNNSLIPTSGVHADNSFFTYIKGNYNRQIVTVRKPSITNRLYVLGAPTIITTEIADVTVEDVLSNQSFAVRGSKNLPASYATSLPVNQTHTGATSFTPGTGSLSAPLIFEGTVDDLSDSNNRQQFGEDLVSYYAGSNISSQDTYQQITNTPVGEEIAYINTLLLAEVGGLSGDNIEISEGEGTSSSGEAPPLFLGNSEDSFVSVWKTDNSGTSNNNQITLPLGTGGSYNFTVDWGDGQTDVIINRNHPEVTHTYSHPGEYEVIIDGGLEGFAFDGSLGGDHEKIREIKQWGSVQLKSIGGLQFYGVKNMQISATDTLDLSNIINGSYMFQDASIQGDLRNLTFPNITNANGMFSNTNISGNLENIVFSNAYRSTSMTEAFSGIDVTGSIDGLELGGATSVSYLFNNAEIGGNIVNFNISDSVSSSVDVFFNVEVGGDFSGNNLAGIVNGNGIFHNAEIGGDFSNNTFENLTNLQFMFNSANIVGNFSNISFPSVISSQRLFVLSTVGGDVQNISFPIMTNANYLFEESDFMGDISNIDLPSLTDADYLFAFSSILGNINNLDLSFAKRAQYMFDGAEILGGMSSVDFSLLENSRFMFITANISGDISNLSFPALRNARDMFLNATIDQDISSWDMDTVTNCTSFSSGTPTSWTVSEKPVFNNCNPGF